MQEKAGAGIELPFHPNIPQQPINNAGHPAEVWASLPILAEIREYPQDNHEKNQLPGAFPALDHAAEVEHPKHVEEQMDRPEMDEDRG
jgi:hypothetical protein